MGVSVYTCVSNRVHESGELVYTHYTCVSNCVHESGELVFARLKDKAATMQGRIAIPLRHDFSSRDVHDDAKETAANWFYKVIHLVKINGALSDLRTNI